MEFVKDPHKHFARMAVAKEASDSYSNPIETDGLLNAKTQRVENNISFIALTDKQRQYLPPGHYDSVPTETTARSKNLSNLSKRNDFMKHVPSGMSNIEDINSDIDEYLEPPVVIPE